MDIADIVRFGAALVFVLALFGIMAMIAKRLGFSARAEFAGAGHRRIGLLDSLPIDAQRRLILVRRDEMEHLILIGPQTDVVVESRIAAHKSQVADLDDEPVESALPALADRLNRAFDPGVR